MTLKKQVIFKYADKKIRHVDVQAEASCHKIHFMDFLIIQVIFPTKNIRLSKEEIRF